MNKDTLSALDRIGAERRSRILGKPIEDVEFGPTETVPNEPSLFKQLGQATGEEAPSVPQIHEEGNIFDAAGATMWGAASGLSWGASGYIEPDEYNWQEMNSAQRAGWVLGEGLSLFAPWGPFGLMGKATAAGGKAITKGALRTVADQTVKRTIGKTGTAVTAKTIKKVAEQTGKSYDEVLEATAGSVKKELSEAATDDFALQWLRGIESKGAEAANSQKLLSDMAGNAIKTAFTESKLPVSDAQVNVIRKAFMDGLKDGRYVNDVGDWIGIKLGGQAPGLPRELVSKYLGMAATDLTMMSAHGLIHGKMREMSKGEHFDVGEALSHSFMMALAFPLIRAVPGGGKESFQTGIKGYLSRYNKSDYSAISQKHGPDVVRNLARVMYSKNRFHPLNHNRLAGQEIMGFEKGSDVIKALNAVDDAGAYVFKDADVIKLLEQTKLNVSKNLVKDWGGKYAFDFVKSIPRIGIGVAAMNPWVFDKGSWGQMDSAELGSHLFISAMMTKGKGAWGHKEQHAAQADYSKHFEAMRVLGANTKDVTGIINYYDSSSAIAGLGGTFYSHHSGRQLFESFDKIVNEYDPKARKDSGFNETRDANTEKFFLWWKMMKGFTMEGGQPPDVDIRTMDRATLNKFESKLKDIKIIGDETMSEVGYEKSLVTITEETSANGLKIAEQLLLDLGSTVGYDVSKEGDQILRISKSRSSKEEDIGVFADINHFIEILDSYGLIKMSSKDGRTIEQLAAQRDESGNKKFETVADMQSTAESMIGGYITNMNNQFGSRDIIHELTDNPYLDFMGQASKIVANDRMYHIMRGNIEPNKKWTTDDGIFLETLDSMFKVQGGNKTGYLKYLSSYVDHIIQNDKKTKEQYDRADDQGKREIRTGVEEKLQGLTQIFELRKKMGDEIETITGPLQKSPNINSEGLKTLIDKYDKFLGELPKGWSTSMFPQVEAAYWERRLSSKIVDQRAYGLISMGIEAGAFRISKTGGDRIIVPSRDAWINGIRATKSIEKDLDVVSEVEGALRQIERVLGKDLVDYSNEWVPTFEGKNSVDINILKDMTSWLGSVHLENVQNARQKLADILSGKDKNENGVLNRLASLQSSLSLIESNLAGTSGTMGDVIGEISKVRDTLDKLKGTLTADENAGMQFAIKQLEASIATIKPDTGEISTELISRVDVGTVEGIIKMLKPMQDKILEAVTGEQKAMLDPIQTISRLESVALKSREMMGLNPVQALDLTDKLIADWYRQYDYADKSKTKVSLEELIDKVNTEGSFRDLTTILSDINQKINMQIFMQSKWRSLNDIGGKVAESLFDGNQIHHHKRTGLEIARDYGLVDERGNINDAFKQRIVDGSTQDIYSVIHEVIRGKKPDYNPDGTVVQGTGSGIFGDTVNYENHNQRVQAWQRFRQREGMELLLGLTNADPYNSVSLTGYDKGGVSVLTFEPNKSSSRSPNQKYYKEKGFKVAFLEDKMTAMVDGKLQSFSMDFFAGGKDRLTGAEAIQFAIDNSFRATDSQELFRQFNEMGFQISEQMITSAMGGEITHPLLYMRLSPADRVLFAVTQENLRILDNSYKDWFNKARKWEFSEDSERQAAAQRKFRQIFEPLTQAEHSYSTTDIKNTSRANSELKMLLPYLTNMGKRQQIKEFIMAAVDGNDVQMAKIQADLYKRGYLSDGGTTQVVNKKALKWFAKGHFSKSNDHVDIKNQALKVLNEGWDGLLVRDESFAPNNANGSGFAMDIRNIALNNLTVIGNRAGTQKQVLSDLVGFMQGKIRNNEYGSLENSLLDGAKFFTKEGMRLLMASSGNLDMRSGVDGMFERGAPNGQKTIIFATGDGNQMLGKGYAIYHPEIARHIPQGVDFIIGESSAKSYDGLSRAASKIEPFELASLQRTADNRLDWSGLSNSNQRNIINIDAESIGVSFASKNADGVTMPASIVDMNSQKSIADWLKVVAIDRDIQVLAEQKNQLFSGESLSKYLYRMNEEHGNMIEHGEAGLSKLILGWGANSDDPMVHGSLIRLARSNAFDIVGKSVVKHGGEDNYISPDVLGDLSNPVYADILGGPRFGSQIVNGKSVPLAKKPSLKNRAIVRFGGIGLNRNTLKRTIGVFTDKDTPTLTGEKFIISDKHGVDWVVNVKDILAKNTNDALEFHSPLYHKGGHLDRGKNNKTFEVKDGKINDVVGLAQSDKFEILRLLRKVHEIGTKPITDASGQVTQEGIRLRDVFKLLNYARTGSNEDLLHNRGRLKKPSIDRVIKYDIQLASVGHAVPVIAYDKPLFRVEKLLKNMNGLVEINSFDLRTLLQRDNDGDHFYSHTKMPWGITKEFSNQLGIKQDFNMWNKKNSLDKDYVNIFGIGENGIAGERNADVGFQNYANKIQKNNMIIGTVIGARGALTWLNRMGLSLDKNPYIKDLLKFEDYIKSEETWHLLDKYLDGIQNSVDKFGGTHQVMDRLFDFIFFGEAGHDHNIKLDKDPHYNNHVKTGQSIFNKAEHSSSRLHKEIFKEILRTVKKANLVSNDTFDEGGGRTPEAFELRDARNSLMSLFANPSKFVQNKMLSRIAWMRQSGKETQIAEADFLFAEYIDLFYGDKGFDLNNKKNRNEMYRNILRSGRDKDVTRLKFSFDNVNLNSQKAGEGRYADFWNKSVNGSKLRKMTSLEIFQDDFHFGPEFRQGHLEKAGLFVKGIEDFINTAHAFGHEPREIINDLMGKENINVFKEYGTFGVKFLDEAIKTSMLKGVVEKQYESVMSQIRFLEGDRFNNSERINRSFDRLLRLQDAMDAIDYQESRGLKWAVNKKGDIHQIISKGNKYEFKELGDKQTVDVYRYKGDIKRGDNDATLADSGINVNQLQFVGRFRKGNTLFMQKGWSYLRNNKPKSRVSMSELETRYGEAWNKVTRASYSDEASGASWEAAVPRDFLKSPNQVDEFLGEVIELRQSINHGWSKTVESVSDKRTKALKNRVYNTNSQREVMLFQEFMQKWIPRLKSEEKDEALWRYVVAPQYVQSQYSTDKDGNIIPVFKANKHLLTTAMNWAINPNVGKADMIREMVGQVRHLVENPNSTVDMTAWEQSHYDKAAINFELLGENTTPFISMSKAMGHWYADPMIMRLIKDVGQPSATRTETLQPSGVKGYPNTPVKMQKFSKGKDKSYMEIHTGRTC